MPSEMPYVTEVEVSNYYSHITDNIEISVELIKTNHADKQNSN